MKDKVQLNLYVSKETAAMFASMAAFEDKKKSDYFDAIVTRMYKSHRRRRLAAGESDLIARELEQIEATRAAIAANRDGG
jgi:hypothetical protein